MPHLPAIDAESPTTARRVTPEPIAQAVVERFKPIGRVLDPCKGDGAFLKFMPGAEWCEIREGRCFYDWKEPVDWVVSNPPYSVFSDFLRHSFTENIVYLIPVNKAFNSDRMTRNLVMGWRENHLRDRLRWIAELPHRLLHRSRPLRARVPRSRRPGISYPERPR